MKKYFVSTSLFFCLLMGCIREEQPNAEADILSVSLADSSILRDIPIIENNKITIHVSSDADLSQQTLSFTLTEGASILPTSGTTRNFTTPQTYTVTSEDGNWEKTYTIAFIAEEPPLTYSFENLVPEAQNRYHIFAEIQNGSTLMEWGSGNAGFTTLGGNRPENYPTMQTPNGYQGKGAYLVTRSTGFFGSLMGMPIAAGNLFTGSFNLAIAIPKPLEATQFGVPFYKKPLSFRGYYKYKAGDTYYKDGSVLYDGTKDKCNIYAVFYETDSNTTSLDGTNILTHPNIISKAVIDNQKETEEWTLFDLPFVTEKGKSIDPDKLRNGKYKLAIVFTSSIDGGVFSGAIGSTLYIDEVQIIVE